MSKDFVLDAWALLAFLQGEEPAATRVRAVIEGAQEGTVRLFISIINIGEVYYRVGKTHSQKEADSALTDLYLLPMEVISADDDTVLAAARLKMTHLLSYADAFAAVTAQQKDATLLTGDPELLDLKRVVKIEKLRR
ncbi:MAG TPA: type II toxin-antitoxin system VapC family toxin [Anaerolineales bacterium]|nr:type II toxin-antitoxin system VapC family toxin [Anaerolineales bacterium]